ncbi:hypothetical protein TRVL_08318 [Trypanosoma vivax]|nr:hypothetical protein TRVL_08318 [Trypanosoma vivax]
MEAVLKRAVGAIGLRKTQRTRVAAFTDSLSLLMALSAGPAVVEDAVLRRIWDLILHLVQLRLSVNFQFVFSHCGTPKARRQTRQPSRETQGRSRDRGGSPTSSLVWGGRCETRCAGPLRRVGCHARIAARCSVTFGQRRSTPSWIVWASRCWRSSERAPRSISGGYIGCSHARWTSWSADGAAPRTQRVTQQRNALRQ